MKKVLNNFILLALVVQIWRGYSTIKCIKDKLMLGSGYDKWCTKRLMKILGHDRQIE